MYVYACMHVYMYDGIIHARGFTVTHTHYASECTVLLVVYYIPMCVVCRHQGLTLLYVSQACSVEAGQCVHGAYVSGQVYECSNACIHTLVHIHISGQPVGSVSFFLWITADIITCLCASICMSVCIYTYIYTHTCIHIYRGICTLCTSQRTGTYYSRTVYMSVSE
jgi:hypothetical protein